MKKRNIIFLFVFVFVMGMGGSFAWYVWQGADINVNVAFSSLDKYLDYRVVNIDAEGNEVTDDNSEEATATKIEYKKKDIATNLDVYGNIYLVKDSVTDNKMFLESNLTWTLTAKNDNGSTLISSGNFVGEEVTGLDSNGEPLKDADGNPLKVIPMAINVVLDDNTDYILDVVEPATGVHLNLDISDMSMHTFVHSDSAAPNDFENGKDDVEYIRGIKYSGGVINEIEAYSSIDKITHYAITSSEDEPTSGWISVDNSLNKVAVLESGFVATITGVNHTMTALNNVCVKDGNGDVFCKSFGDTGNPTGTINMTYAAEADDGVYYKKEYQTVSLTCSDTSGLVSYYFGQTNPASGNVTYQSIGQSGDSFNKTVNLKMDSEVALEDRDSGFDSMAVNWTNNSATFYLSCKDSFGNVSTVVSKQFVSYVVQNRLLTVTGTWGTYNSTNFALVENEEENNYVYNYMIHNGAYVSRSGSMTAPPGANSSSYAASLFASTDAIPSTGTATTDDAPVINTTNRILVLWINRLEYNVTVNVTDSCDSGGLDDSSVTVVNERGTSVTATENNAKTLKVRYGEKVTSTANPDGGYSFTGWSGGFVSGTTNPITSAAITAAKTITGSFCVNRLEVTLKENGSNASTTGYSVSLSTSSSTDTATFSGTTSGSTILFEKVVTGTTYYIWSGKSSNAKTTRLYSGVSVKITSITSAATINYYGLTLAKGTGISAVSNGGTSTTSAVQHLYNSSSPQTIAIDATVTEGYTWSTWTKTSGTNLKTFTAATKSQNVQMGAGAATLTASATYTPTPTITRSDYNTFTYSATGASAYYVSTSSSAPAAGTDAASSTFALNTWTTATSTGDLTLAAGTTYYVFVKDATTGGNVSSNKASIVVRTITRTQGTGSTLTTKYESSSGTAFDSATTYVLNGTPIWASSTANSGYNTATLTMGGTSKTASGDTATASADMAIVSGATANVVKINIYKDGAAWSASGIKVTLYNGTTATSYTATVSSGSQATLNAVPNGTYNIYAGKSSLAKTTLLDSGVDVTVNSNSPSAVTVNYYTLTLAKGTGISTVSNAGQTTTLAVQHLYNSSSPQTIAIDATVTSGYTWSTWTKTSGTNLKTFTAATKSQNVQMGAGAATLTASAELSTFTVNYYCTTNGGTTANSSETVASGASVDLTKTCAKSGWTFVGWNTSSTATSGLSSYTMPNSDLALYAIYSKSGAVTFNLNGNSSFTYGGTTYTATTSINICTMYNKDTSCTASVTMPTIAASSNTPTVIGWSTAAATHTATYTSGQTNVTLTSGSTYYAQSSKAALTYTATTQKNVSSATGTATSAQCTIAAVYNGATQGTSCNVTLPSNPYTLTAWTFNGWVNGGSSTTTATTSGTAAAGTMSISGNVNIIATWKKTVTVTVTFDKNGGSANTAASTTTTLYNGSTSLSETLTFTAPACTTYSGWTCLGYNTSDSATTSSWNVGATKDISVSGTVAIGTTTFSKGSGYSHIWKKDAITYTITFQKNVSSATGTLDSDTCTIAAVYNGETQDTSCEYTLPANPYTLTAWTFNGWVNAGSSTTTSEGSGTLAGGTMSISGNVNIVATWKKTVTVTVTFDKNGGSANTTSAGVTTTLYNGSTSLSKSLTFTAPACTTYSGWTCLGYNTSASATSSAWNAGATKSISVSGTVAIGNTTFSKASGYYHIWQKAAKTYTATFQKQNTNISSIGSTSLSCTIAAVYNGATQGTSCSITLPTITPATNYYDTGWKLSSSYDAAEDEYNNAPGASVSISANVTYSTQAYLANYGIYEDPEAATPTYYRQSISKAFNAVTGSTIKVLRTFTDSTTGTVASGRTFTFNTNGQTLTLSNTITNNGSLSITGTGTIANTTKTTLITYGTLNIGTSGATTGPTISGIFSATGSYAIQGSGGTLNMYSGEVKSNLYAIDCVHLTSNLTVNVYGGVLNTEDSAYNTSVASLFVSYGDTSDYSTTIYIYGGEFISKGTALSVTKANSAAYVYAGTFRTSAYDSDTCIYTLGTSGSSSSTSGGTIELLRADPDTGPDGDKIKVYNTCGKMPYEAYSGSLYYESGHFYHSDSKWLYNGGASITYISSYLPVTVANSTYGYETYLVTSTDSAAVYEISDSYGTRYSNALKTAIDATYSGGTIKALVNNSSGAVSLSKTLTLNPNSKTITMTGTFTNSGTLNISGSGTITSSSVNTIKNTGTLNVTSATITSTSSSKYAIVNSGSGTSTVNSGTLTNTSFVPISLTGGTVKIKGGTITGSTYGIDITKGTLNVSSGTITAGTYAVRTSTLTGAVTIKITGGTLKIGTAANAYCAALHVNGSSSYATTLTMSAGNLTNTSNGYGLSIGATNVTATITGGTIRGVSYGISNHGSLTIGNSSNAVSTSSPKVIGNTRSIYATGNWNFYDGALYADNKTPTYYNEGATTTFASGYTVTTVSDTTYATTGKKSYLTASSTYSLRRTVTSLDTYMNTISSDACDIYYMTDYSGDNYNYNEKNLEVESGTLSYSDLNTAPSNTCMAKKTSDSSTSHHYIFAEEGLTIDTASVYSQIIGVIKLEEISEKYPVYKTSTYYSNSDNDQWRKLYFTYDTANEIINDFNSPYYAYTNGSLESLAYNDTSYYFGWISNEVIK